MNRAYEGPIKLWLTHRVVLVCLWVVLGLPSHSLALADSDAETPSATSTADEDKRGTQEAKPDIADWQKVDALIRKAIPLELYKLSPYVVADAFAFALPAVRDLRQRLQVIERVVQARRLPVRHNFQALYGSNFLRDNPVGNDLDYMLGIHLGAIRLNPDRPELAAEKLLSRTEQYLQVLDAVFQRFEAPALAVQQFSPLQNGGFPNRQGMLERLTASLHDVARGQPHQLMVQTRSGLRVPSILPPNESYIGALTRIQLLSNRVWSVDWMFPGIRGVQVMFHFFCRLEIESAQGRLDVVENFLLHPTFLPSGAVLDPSANLLWTVPTDAPSAGLFSALALADGEHLAEVRIEMARQLSADVERNLNIGVTTKALKRLQQVRENLFPALDAQFASELGGVVAAALGNRDILRSQQVAEMASSARYIFRNPTLLSLYRDSGDLQRTLIQIDRDIDDILLRHPTLRSSETDAFKEQLAGLTALLDEPTYATSHNEARDLLGRIEKWGQSRARQFGPAEEQVAQGVEAIREFLRQAGVYPLPIYGLADGSVGVLDEDLERLGLNEQEPTQAIVANGGPAFDYRRITASERPKNSTGMTLPESKRLWLFLGRSEQERQLARELKAALVEDSREFRQVPVSSSASMREVGRKALLERFGAAGAQAWEQSTTQGDALLALLDVEEKTARGLLDTHLGLLSRIGAAVVVMPALATGDNGFQVALERALRHTSEGVLEGLAIGQRSEGRRGLDPQQAKRAQRQLSQLLTALMDIAQNQATLMANRDTPDGSEIYRIRTATGNGVIRLLLRSQSHGKFHRGRIEFGLEEIEGKPVQEVLLLNFQPSDNGGTYTLRFSSDRLNWGVHGRSPTDHFVPDQFFFDGMPMQFQPPRGPLARETMLQVFDRYVEERFLPRVVEDLPSSP